MPSAGRQFDWEIQSRANKRSLIDSVLASVYEGFGESFEGPTLSATQSGLQRNLAALLRVSLEIAAIPQVLPSKGTRESVPPNPGGRSCGPFLRMSHPQSGCNDFLRRMPCDHKPMMWRKRLVFVCFWECRLMLPTRFLRLLLTIVRTSGPSSFTETRCESIEVVQKAVPRGLAAL